MDCNSFLQELEKVDSGDFTALTPQQKSLCFDALRSPDRDVNMRAASILLALGSQLLESDWQSGLLLKDLADSGFFQLEIAECIFSSLDGPLRAAGLEKQVSGWNEEDIWTSVINENFLGSDLDRLKGALLITAFRLLVTVKKHSIHLERILRLQEARAFGVVGQFRASLSCLRWLELQVPDVQTLSIEKREEYQRVSGGLKDIDLSQSASWNVGEYLASLLTVHTLFRFLTPLDEVAADVYPSFKDWRSENRRGRSVGPGRYAGRGEQILQAGDLRGGILIILGLEEGSKTDDQKSKVIQRLEQRVFPWLSRLEDGTKFDGLLEACLSELSSSLRASIPGGYLQAYLFVMRHHRARTEVQLISYRLEQLVLWAKLQEFEASQDILRWLDELIPGKIDENSRQIFSGLILQAASAMSFPKQKLKCLNISEKLLPSQGSNRARCFLLRAREYQNTVDFAGVLRALRLAKATSHTDESLRTEIADEYVLISERMRAHGHSDPHKDQDSQLELEQLDREFKIAWAESGQKVEGLCELLAEAAKLPSLILSVAPTPDTLLQSRSVFQGIVATASSLVHRCLQNSLGLGPQEKVVVERTASLEGRLLKEFSRLLTAASYWTLQSYQARLLHQQVRLLPSREQREFHDLSQQLSEGLLQSQSNNNHDRPEERELPVVIDLIRELISIAHAEDFLARSLNFASPAPVCPSSDNAIVFLVPLRTTDQTKFVLACFEENRTTLLPSHQWDSLAVELSGLLESDAAIESLMYDPAQQTRFDALIETLSHNPHLNLAKVFGSDASEITSVWCQNLTDLNLPLPMVLDPKSQYAFTLGISGIALTVNLEDPVSFWGQCTYENKERVRIDSNRREVHSISRKGEQRLVLSYPGMPIEPVELFAAVDPLVYSNYERWMLEDLADQDLLKVRFYGGIDSTRSKFLEFDSPDASVLHISTHGECTTGTPEMANLWLSGNVTKTSRIHYLDILSMDLTDVDLVFLNACVTDQGAGTGGDERFSLAWAFLAAGAKSVIASRWYVPDDAAFQFAKFFYGEISRKQSVPKAFQYALRSLRQQAKFASPLVWGTFVLIENPNIHSDVESQEIGERARLRLKEPSRTLLETVTKRLTSGGGDTEHRRSVGGLVWQNDDYVCHEAICPVCGVGNVFNSRYFDVELRVYFNKGDRRSIDREIQRMRIKCLHCSVGTGDPSGFRLIPLDFHSHTRWTPEVMQDYLRLIQSPFEKHPSITSTMKAGKIFQYAGFQIAESIKLQTQKEKTIRLIEETECEEPTSQLENSSNLDPHDWKSVSFIAEFVQSHTVRLAIDELKRAIEASEDEDQRLLQLFRAGLISEADFLDRHPELASQSMWNRVWWFDSDFASRHAVIAAANKTTESLPWNQQLRASTIISKETEVFPDLWVRSLLPPRAPIDSRLIANCVGHTESVSWVAVAPAGKRVASLCRLDKSCRIWDIARSGLEIQRLDLPNGCSMVQFSPAGDAVILRQEKGVFGAWSVESGERVEELSGSEIILISLVYSEGGARAMSMDIGGTVRCYGFELAIKPSAVNVGFQGETPIAVSNEGQKLVCWNAETGEEISSIPLDIRVSQTSCVISPDGQTFAAWEYGGACRIWDCLTAQLIFSGEFDQSPECTFSSSSQHFAISTDSTHLLGSLRPLKTRIVDYQHQSVDSFFLNNTEMLGIYDYGSVDLFSLDSPIGLSSVPIASGRKCVGVNPDSRHVYYTEGELDLRLWDVGCNQERQELAIAAESNLNCAALTDDHLASGSETGLLRVWNIQPKSDTNIASHRGHVRSITGFAWSPRGHQLAECIFGWLRVVDDSMKEILLHIDDRGIYSQVAYSPDGSQLACIRDSRTIEVIDCDSFQTIVEVDDHKNRIEDLAFSTDGNSIVCCELNGEVSIWDLNSATKRNVLSNREFLPQNGPSAIAWSSSGDRILIGGSEGSVWMWNGGELLSRVPSSHGLQVTRTQFSQDGDRFCTVGWDRTTFLFDTKTGERIQQWEGLVDPVTILDSPVSGFFALAQDHEVVIYSTDAGRPVAWYPHRLHNFVAHPSKSLWVGHTLDNVEHRFQLERGLPDIN